jgi:hypothetical protein
MGPVEYPLVGGSNPEVSAYADSERTINFIPQANGAGAKTRGTLYQAPGLTIGAVCGAVAGTYVLATYPSELGLYVLIGNQLSTSPILYRLTAATNFLPTVANLGAVPIAGGGDGWEMAMNNQRQLMICGAQATPCLYDENIGNFRSITGFPLAVANRVVHSDGWFIVSANTLGSTQFCVNQTANVGQTFDPLGFSSLQDGMAVIQALGVLRRELWIFTDSQITVYYNSGATFPYARIPGAVLPLSLAAKWSPQLASGSFFFVGSETPKAAFSGIFDPPGPQLSVYRTNGYNADRVSTDAIDNILSTWQGDYIRSWTYQERGHVFYALKCDYTHSTVYTSNAPSLCVVYDVTANLWHERSMVIPGVYTEGGHIGVNGVNWMGQTWIGSGAQPNLYRQTASVFTDTQPDATGIVTRTRIGPPIAAPGNTRNEFHAFVLDVEDGYPASYATAQTAMSLPATQSFSLSWSDDGGRTWSTPVTVSQPTNDGTGGAYRKRFLWRRLGKARTRSFKVTTSDLLPVRITGAFVDYETLAN